MKKISKNIILLLVVLLSSQGIFGQSNTMYYLTDQPYSNRLNPASQPYCSFYLGLPIVSGIYSEVKNNSIGISDLIWNDAESEKVIHPLHPNASFKDFLNGMPDVNSLSGKLEFNLFSLGFRIDNLYFTYDAIWHHDYSVGYPTDLVDFLVSGNTNNTQYDLSGLHMRYTTYLEQAIGVSYNYNDVLWVGVRPKLLSGLMHLNAESSAVLLNTSVERWQIESQMDMEMGLPGVSIPTDADGNLDLQESFEADSSFSVQDIFANKGLGIDLGVHYKPIDALTLSISAIDIGSITWNKNNHTSTINADFEFDGIGLTINENDSTADFLPTLIDTITNNITTEGTDEPFKTTLRPKLFLGGSYALTSTVNAGVLVRFDLPHMDEDLETNFMFHANWHPSSVLAISTSFIPYGKKGATVGLGTFLRVGIFSYYLVLDYFPTSYTKYKYNDLPGIPWPSQGIYKFNVRTGFSIVIGNNKNRILRKDKPMYYSEDNQ